MRNEGTTCFLIKNMLCLLVMHSAVLQAQVTIEVEVLGAVASNEAVYISGNFEGWTGGQEAYRLHKKNNAYWITLAPIQERIEFKFTKGSWDRVETSSAAGMLANRTYQFGKVPDSIKLTVAQWASNADLKSSATSNVHLVDTAFTMPQLGATRRIWIYLPKGYVHSSRRYPVLYMHDGQNLFDQLHAFSGEWNVDESLNQLGENDQLKLIVVGIENGGETRIDEYSPWVNQTYGGGKGAAYLSFIVECLKPYIDAHYKTLSEAKYTGIMGSSMGGLISYYAAMQYPSVFGRVGVFSPSLWFSDKVYELPTNKPPHAAQKIYFLAGEKEGETMVPNLQRVLASLETNGYNESHYTTKIVSDGMHNETFWSTEFKEAVVWLFTN